MVLLRVIVFFLSVATCANAQEISDERKAAMVPWVAHDRDQAMNDRALCSGDLVSIGKQLDAARKEIDGLKKQVEDLKPKTPEK